MKCEACNGEGEIWFSINLGGGEWDSDSYKCESCNGAGRLADQRGLR